MAWKAYFWLMGAVLILPFPFKLWAYASGRDKSRVIVKIEELANACFMTLGLWGLYGYVYQADGGPAWLWYLWLLCSLVWSLLGLVWSPKLEHAAAVLGPTRSRILAVISTIISLPMILGIYRYASE